MRRKNPGLREQLWWNAMVRWHRVRVLLRSPKSWVSGAITLGFWVALGWPIYQVRVWQGVLHTLFTIAVLFTKAVRYASPRMMHPVQHDFLVRQGLLYRLVVDVQDRRPRKPQELHRFQVEALQLIASYVRSHRADSGASEIFVNLLVEDGEDLVVVARDRDHRLPSPHYSKRDTLAFRTLTTGEAVCTGDVVEEFGKEWAAKPYRSILTLPVRTNHKIVAVVSIDSSRAHHFDLEWRELDRELAPYVALLGWTLR